MGFEDYFHSSINAAANLGVGIANTVNSYRTAEWMKYAQEKTWEREDNAVQRRVADLQAAGLSPTLAAGSSAQASSPIQVPSARVDDKLSNLTAQKLYLEMIQQKENIAQTIADRERIKAQTEGQEIANRYTGERMAAENRGLSLDNSMKEFNVTNQDLERTRRQLENERGFMELGISKREFLIKAVTVEEKRLEFDEKLRSIRLYRQIGKPYGSHLEPEDRAQLAAWRVGTLTNDDWFRIYSDYSKAWRSYDERMD
ncbi:MAG: hypothetical protein LBF77_04630 [Spirochaetaceae bacterium]|jgi:hypothetical protein|nr:hypothetical protein [Spirochaetaceae bacterium]